MTSKTLLALAALPLAQPASAQVFLEGFAGRSFPESERATITAAEEDELHRELQRPLRAMALVGVAVEKAFGCRPSTGDTPRPLQLPDPRSPSTTAAAEVKPSPIRPPNLHKTHSMPWIHRAKGQRTHLPMSRPPRTPV